MNQFSLNIQPSNTLFYSNNNNNNNNEVVDDITTSSSITPSLDKEHMFEKPLTPSDVGKLNRLVIPKQHAEKYLPLATTTAAVDGGGSGVLLGFEDELGKCWKFRYSYWNSSQSYVLTKGWSRYVKDKKLDAGDVVLFHRHRFEPNRFFIGWRRRGSNINLPVQGSNSWTARSNYNFNVNNNNNNYNNRDYNCNYGGYGNQQHNVLQSQQFSAFPNFPPAAIYEGSVQVRQKAKKSGSGNSKRVRLFGVNLECQEDDDDDDDQVIEDEPQISDGSSVSSHGQGLGSGLGLGSTMGPISYNHLDYMGYPPNYISQSHGYEFLT